MSASHHAVNAPSARCIASKNLSEKAPAECLCQKQFVKYAKRVNKASSMNGNKRGYGRANYCATGCDMNTFNKCDRNKAVSISPDMFFNSFEDVLDFPVHSGRHISPKGADIYA